MQAAVKTVACCSVKDTRSQVKTTFEWVFECKVLAVWLPVFAVFPAEVSLSFLVFIFQE